MICKEKHDTSDLKTQQQQVGPGKQVRMRSTTICPFDCLSAHPPMHAFTHLLTHPYPIQPPTVCYLGVHFSVLSQVLMCFQSVSRLNLGFFLNQITRCICLPDQQTSKLFGSFICAQISMTVCSPPIRIQYSNEQDLKRLEERLQFLLKQKKVITPEKDMAENLWHHFEASQMRQENRMVGSPVSEISVINEFLLIPVVPRKKQGAKASENSANTVHKIFFLVNHILTFSESVELSLPLSLQNSLYVFSACFP